MPVEDSLRSLSSAEDPIDSVDFEHEIADGAALLTKRTPEPGVRYWLCTDGELEITD